MVRNNNYHKDNKKAYRTCTKDIQQREEQMSHDSAFFDSFPQDIKNIITKLRITVDHIDSPRNYARDLIRELARQLDERRLCERDCISIKIKEILEDKIHAGKVTERWITKCLPHEYKREYAKDKRELSSLLEKRPGTECTPAITVGNNGQQTTSNEYDIPALKEPTSNQQSNPANQQKSDWKIGSKLQLPEQVTNECTSCLELQDEVTQLREALQRISIPTADQIQASGFELIIPKEEYEMVKDAMDKSKSAIFVKCDASKKFLHVKPDMYN